MKRALLTAAVGSAALLAAMVAMPVMAQRPQLPPGPPNPFQGQAEAAAAGQKVYETNCLACHGVNGGAGTIGPALVNATRNDTPRTPGQLFNSIKNGVAGTPMPPHADKLSDDDIWRTVTYIVSLRGTAIDNPTPGDAPKGEQVFWGKGQCGTCHMVKGKGGLQGPELSNLAAYRKTQSIIDALTKPYHKVYPPGGDHLEELPVASGGYLPVTVTGRDGKVTRGVLLGQDTYTLQVIGDDQKLHLFVRSEVRGVAIEPRSRMPTDYDKRLTPEEFKNLLAYLTRQANMPRPGAARAAN